MSALCLLCGLLCADASVHGYAGERFAAVGNAFVLNGGSEGIYFSPSADSFIRFEKVAFRRTPESAAAAEDDGNRTATVTAVLFEAADRDAIGAAAAVPGSGSGWPRRELCCTPAMARRGACTEGSLVLAHRAPNNANSSSPKVLSASFLPGALEASFPDETIPVPRTGMYNLRFVHCHASLAAVAVGKTIWKNGRGGYLPGRMAPLETFYGAMSLAFAALAAFWFLRYARHWREVAPVQNLLTLAIALGMVEVTAWYLDLAEFGASGVRPPATTFWAATASASRRAVSRVLALLVAMGYGAARPTLRGGVGIRVAALGAAYFAASETLEVVQHVGAVSDDHDHYSPASGKTILFLLALPVAVLDSTFICLIFVSLSRTLRRLRARRSKTARLLDTYRRFGTAVTIAAAVSLGWAAFEAHFRWTEGEERWRVAWVIPAVWQLISFALLCAVCLLWAPSHDSASRFADDAGVFRGDDDGVEEEEKLPLVRVAGPLSYVGSWACYVTRDDDAKIILRTDSGGVYAMSGQEGKRV